MQLDLRKILVFVIPVVLLLGFFGIKFLQTPDLQNLSATVLKTPRVLPNFSLQGIDGRTFDNSSLQGHFSLLFFGYTQCKSICPLTMANLNKMYLILQKNHVKHMPQVVMISLDSKRDDLTILADYVHHFNPHFYGATSAEKNLQSLSNDLGIAYLQVKSQDGSEQYEFEHTGAIILLNPQSELLAFFTPPHDFHLLAQEYTIISNSLG
jgi:protein SCO1